MKNRRGFKIVSSAVILAAMVFTIASCKKKEDNPTPAPTPDVTFTITSPSEGQTFHKNDTVWFKGTATAAKDLHGYELKVTDKGKNTVVFEYEAHAHGKTITIDSFWVNNIADHSDMELDIEAIKDHEGNKESKHIHFHCHPM